MSELAYHDFRSFIEEAKKISDYRIIENADWDGEIGALVESTAELVPQPPMLIFDKVKGYPAGYRVCSLPYAAYRRVALALGLPIFAAVYALLNACMLYERNGAENAALAQAKEPGGTAQTLANHSRSLELSAVRRGLAPAPAKRP